MNAIQARSCGRPFLGEDLLDHGHVAARALEPCGDLVVEGGALEGREHAQHGVVDDEGNVGGNRGNRRGDFRARRGDFLGRRDGGLDLRELGRDLPVRSAGFFGGAGQGLVALDAVPELVGELEPRPRGGGASGGTHRGDGLAEVEARALDVARQRRLAPEGEGVGGADGRRVGRGLRRRGRGGGLLRRRGAAGGRHERGERGKPLTQGARRRTHQQRVNAGA